MKPKLEVGLSLTVTKIVPPEWSADKMGNPGIDVFATPAVVGLLDVLAHECILPTLDPGQGTVGTDIKIQHLAATPIGMRVHARAEVVEIKDRRVLVRVEAFDAFDKIAAGTIERYVVPSIAKFLERVAIKSKRGENGEQSS